MNEVRGLTDSTGRRASVVANRLFHITRVIVVASDTCHQPSERNARRGTMTDLGHSRMGDQLVADDRQDLELTAELARTAVASQLAILVTRYRVEHGLTQTALARQLGMRQPAVARLEAGDHEPSVTTLARLANKLGINLRLDLSPDSVALVSA